MPLYEVFHAIPLSREQKDAIAGTITDLHSTSFSTPRFFVNVRFEQPAPAGDIYAGGKHRGNRLPNYIAATIRVGPTRTKKNFDDLGVKLTKKWDEVVASTEGLEHLDANQQRRAKKLKAIVFRPMVAALENGVVVPEAGGEATWLSDNLAFFRQRANDFDDPDFKEILEEAEAK